MLQGRRSIQRNIGERGDGEEKEEGKLRNTSHSFVVLVKRQRSERKGSVKGLLRYSALLEA